MLSLARMIKALAERHSLAAVVSNHVVGGGSGGFVKPALGEHWRNQPSWRLLLSNQQGSSVKVAQRLASPLHVSWAWGLLHFKADDICMHTGLDIPVGGYKLHQGAGVHLRAAPSKAASSSSSQAAGDCILFTITEAGVVDARYRQ